MALLAGCSTKPSAVDRQTTTSVSTAERTVANPTVVTTTTVPPATRTEVSVTQEAPRPPVERPETHSQTVENDPVAAVQQPAKAEVPAADRDFALEAARAGQKEVQLGNLAASQAGAPPVRDFAQQMVADHSAANDELKTLASAAGLTLPAVEPASSLADLTGAQFDQAYVAEMVSDHQKAVALFEKEANQGTHKALRDFATAQLPTLSHHLQMAQELQAKLAE